LYSSVIILAKPANIIHSHILFLYKY
jgi:hypothetical protein